MEMACLQEFSQDFKTFLFFTYFFKYLICLIKHVLLDFVSTAASLVNMSINMQIQIRSIITFPFNL